jgi:hypothetical protein
VIKPRPEPESFATVLMLWFMSSREREGERREKNDGNVPLWKVPSRQI